MSNERKNTHLQKANIDEAFASFSTYWDPRILAELNGQMVKVAKLKGEFIWHSHEHEDELFLVVAGTLIIKVRGQDDVVLNQGDCVVIPRGVEHKPVAEEEVQLLLFEPATTLNTGEVHDERTKKILKRI